MYIYVCVYKGDRISNVLWKIPLLLGSLRMQISI